MKRYIKCAFDINDPLAFCSDVGARRRLASITEDPELLLVYAGDPDFLVRHRVLDNPFITPEVLEVMSEDPSADIRSYVAYNAATSDATLLKLAQDPDLGVRASVFDKHPDLPGLAELMMQSSNMEDRTYLAITSQDPNVLVALANDPQAHVRYNVLVNPLTPTATLRQLAKDPESWIADKAKERLKHYR